MISSGDRHRNLATILIQRLFLIFFDRSDELMTVVFMSSEDFLFGLGGVPPVPTLVTAIFGIQDGSNDNGDYTSITGVGGSIFDANGNDILDVIEFVSFLNTCNAP